MFFPRRANAINCSRDVSCRRLFQYLTVVILSLVFGVAVIYGSLFLALCLLLFLVLGTFVLRNAEVATVLLTALFPINNLITFRVIFIDIRLIEVGWLFLVTLLALQEAARLGPKRVAWERGDLFMVFFIVLSVAQMFFTSYWPVVFKDSFQYFYFFSLYFVLRQIFDKEANRTLFLKVMMVVTTVFCLFGILQAAIGTSPLKVVFVNLLSGSVQFSESLLENQYVGQHELLRINSFFWGSVGTANILIILYYLIKNIKSPFSRILQAVIVIMVLLTGSRGGWFAFFAVFVMEAIIFRRKPLLKILIVFAIVGTVAAAVPAVGERLREAFSPAEASNRNHFAIWLASWDIFQKNFLFGLGSGCLPYFLVTSNFYFEMFRVHAVVMESHNLVVKILAENGIIGFALLGLFFLTVFRHVRRFIHRENEMTVYFFLAFLGTVLMNMTMNAFTIEPFWITLALLTGSARAAQRRNP